MITDRDEPSPFRFLLSGAGRGGTSLIAGLLASHPQLQVGFEQHAGILLGNDEAKESGPASDSRIARFRQACEADALSQRKIWGNKVTTEQIHATQMEGQDEGEVIAAFFEHFGDLRHVFIIRDGRTCIRSKVNRTGQPVMKACHKWHFSVQVYRYFLEKKVNGITIRFEDLISTPETVLPPICEFLGIDYSSEMLAGTNHPGMLPEYRQASFNPSKTEVTPISEEALAFIEDDLRFCGYLA